MICETAGRSIGVSVNEKVNCDNVYDRVQHNQVRIMSSYYDYYQTQQPRRFEPPKDMNYRCYMNYQKFEPQTTPYGDTRNDSYMAQMPCAPCEPTQYFDTCPKTEDALSNSSEDLCCNELTAPQSSQTTAGTYAVSAVPPVPHEDRTCSSLSPGSPYYPTTSNEWER